MIVLCHFINIVYDKKRKIYYKLYFFTVLFYTNIRAVPCAGVGGGGQGAEFLEFCKIPRENDRQAKFCIVDEIVIFFYLILPLR